jgi:hypothetical protein
MKQILSKLTFYVAAAFLMSCAHKSINAAKTAAVPVPDTTTPTVEGKLDTGALTEKLSSAEKFSIPEKKSKPAKRRLQSVKPKEAALQPAPAIAAPTQAEAVQKPEEVKPSETAAQPEEANASIGDFFLMHWTWILGLFAIGATYAFFAARKQQS